jgi:hypothetical protein
MRRQNPIYPMVTQEESLLLCSLCKIQQLYSCISLAPFHCIVDTAKWLRRVACSSAGSARSIACGNAGFSAAHTVCGPLAGPSLPTPAQIPSQCQACYCTLSSFLLSRAGASSHLAPLILLLFNHLPALRHVKPHLATQKGVCDKQSCGLQCGHISAGLGSHQPAPGDDFHAAVHAHRHCADQCPPLHVSPA